MKDRICVALAGNPNAGKTCIFNALTGARQRVGNYPGVTVERREGLCRFGDAEVRVLDLPGTYSLTAYSLEERIARDAILDSEVDVVIDVIDSTNLDRNLYLTTQLLEIGKPLVLALNMSDEARAMGVEIDVQRLSEVLGVPVVETVGHRGLGVQEMLARAVAVARGEERCAPPRIHYGPWLEPALDRLAARIETLPPDTRPSHPARWIALKLLEDDEIISARVGDPAVREEARRLADEIAHAVRERAELLAAEGRYGFIAGLCQQVFRHTPQLRHTKSDCVDAVVAHPVLGIPIFLLMMFLVFRFTFALSEPMMGALEAVFQWLGRQVSDHWPGAPDSLLLSLIREGLIGGVGSVLTFIPNIVLLFFAISLLEDSGYMARAAFLADHLMRRIGLQGRSFIPMLLGFGCSVPGILATRAMEPGPSRLATILVLPLMSCGARLTIYMLLIPAFFPRHLYALVLWLVYLSGIVGAIVLARLLRSTLLRGDTAPMVIELPPYRWPPLRNAGLRMWTQTSHYLRRAGTIILAVSVVLWALSTFPRPARWSRDYDAERSAWLSRADTQARELFTRAGLPDLRGDPDFEALVERINELFDDFDERMHERGLQPDDPDYIAARLVRDEQLARLREGAPERFEPAFRYAREIAAPLRAALERIELERRHEQLTYSWAGRIGRALEPALRPLGFDWRIATALIGAVAAKEVFVAQMGIMFAIGEENLPALRQRLREQYSVLTAVSLLLFCLLSAPCMATLAVTRQEAGGWRWAMLQVSGLTAFAYLVSLAVYQIGQRIWG